MSRFFDQARKDQERAVEVPSTGMNLEEYVTLVKGAGTASAKIAEGRLSNCRKIRIGRPANFPVLLEEAPFGKIPIESYRTLRTRLLRLQSSQGLRSIVVGSASAGDGKTVTVVNLALCCAQLPDMRVLIIDADLRNRGLTGLLGSPMAPGLSEVLASQAKFEDAVLATEHPNLYVVATGGLSVAPTELLAGDKWKELIGWCEETFRLVLIDCPPVIPLADFELITPVCDGVLIVVRARGTNRGWLARTAAQLDAKKLLGVVFNGTESNKQRYTYGSYLSENQNRS